VEKLVRYELALRLEHDCPYTKFSQSMPKAVTMHWCNNDKDVLEISTPSEITRENLESRIEKLTKDLSAKIVRNVAISENLRIMVYLHRSSSMKQNVNAIIERCNCIEIQPTVYREGSEWYRIIAFSDADVRELHQILSKFAKVRTVSQSSLPDSSIKSSVMIPSSGVLGNLTKKQQNALRSALTLGYFDIPPRTSTQFMAEQYGVARTTFEEHLRKAEEKILKSLLPYLEMQP
jgi:predicted DNA binding protein